MTDIPVRRALVSVYDKTGLADLAKGLSECGVAIVSTGSTAATIRDAGVDVTDVSQVTGFPEIMDGRVKTLHPAVHAGILADRSKPAHDEALAAHDLSPFELVIVNLYPFSSDPSIELIDIGGPTMVRAAAKNHGSVAVVVDPADYDGIVGQLRTAGSIAPAQRRALAAKAFGVIAEYDAQIAQWFATDEPFPPVLATTYRRAQELRYGENPHQTAAYYVEPNAWGLGSAVQLHGKELSYNNLLDTDAAWGAATDFADPCIAIIKHMNPAGLAVGTSLSDAYPRALAGDTVSAFGGIVAANRPIDGATARQIVEVFTEVVVAPGFDDEALEVLRTKKNLRILRVERPQPPAGGAARAASVLTSRTISGGLLVQDADVAAETPSEWTVATQTKPDDDLMAEMQFAWQACKHVKSNAIVLTVDRAVVGVGAGQMSRVDSVEIAVKKSGGRSKGAVLASDAFFPFRDGPDAALAAGVRAIVQPGGSVRDEEVIAACDELGVPMVFTGRRHFRH